MSLPERFEERIGDAERSRALTRLSDLTGTGHLDLPEFEDRSARITAARTHADIDAVFADLPAERDAAGAVSKRRDNLKIAGTALSTVGVMMAAGFLAMPWLFLLAFFIPVLVWLSGRGPAGFYRDETA